MTDNGIVFANSSERQNKNANDPHTHGEHPITAITQIQPPALPVCLSDDMVPLDESDIMKIINQLEVTPTTGSIQVNTISCLELLAQIDWSLHSENAFKQLVSVLASRITVWADNPLQSSISVIKNIMEYELFEELDAKQLIFALMVAMEKLDTTYNLNDQSLFTHLGEVLHTLFLFCSFDKDDYAIVQELALTAYRSADWRKRRFLIVVYRALIESKTDEEIIDRHAIPFLMNTLNANDEQEIRSEFVLVIAHGLLKLPVPLQLDVLWCEIMHLWHGKGSIDQKGCCIAVNIVFDMLNDKDRVSQLGGEKERQISNFLVDVLVRARQTGCLRPKSAPCEQHLIDYMAANIPVLLRIAVHIVDKEVRKQSLKLIHALCRCPFQLVRVVMARQFPEACKIIFETHSLHWTVQFVPTQSGLSSNSGRHIIPRATRQFGIEVPSPRPRPMQKEAKKFLLSMVRMLEDSSQEVKVAMMNGLDEVRNLLSAYVRSRFIEYRISMACHRSYKRCKGSTYGDPRRWSCFCAQNDYTRFRRYIFNEVGSWNSG